MNTKRWIRANANPDGVDRRGFLECMAWAGTGAVCVVAGGVLRSFALGDPRLAAGVAAGGELMFAQISDSHIGFHNAANPDVVGTLHQAIAKINALPAPPALVLHTGDLSHLSKPAQFDTLYQSLIGLRTERIFYVPGEHDVLDDGGAGYRRRFAPKAQGEGWYSFDIAGVHFIGLVNVVDLRAGGMGNLGEAQLAWLAEDVRPLASSTPIVVFAHIPLWSVYPQWGWGTNDAARALARLERFGSVTVLNGHIHQTMRKVEGNVTFHTAMSTAFPQAAPGQAPAPGPMKVPPGRLRALLGVTDVTFVPGRHTLGIVDSPLEAM